MQEIIRTIILLIATIIFAGSYLKLLSSAFRRDMLWGIFSLFAMPFGGWLHALTSWWDNSRLFIVHIATGCLAFCAFFLFPRAPMNGFWTDDTSDLVFDIKTDGNVRDYSLAPDCSYQLRPARIITRDLPFKSPVRLRFSGSRGFDLGWYKPSEGIINLYDSAKDPSLINNLDHPVHSLKRVTEPNAPAFLAKLELLTSRETIADRARLLVQNYRTQPISSLLTEDSLARLQRYIALARANTGPTDDSLPDQIYTLHLRTRLGNLLKQNPSTETVLAALLKETDFLLFGTLQRLDLESVNLTPGETKGSVLFVSQVPGIQAGPRAINLLAQKDKNGLWRFNLFQLRDEHIKQTINNRQLPPGSSAEEYLEYDAMTAGRPSWR